MYPEAPQTLVAVSWNRTLFALGRVALVGEAARVKSGRHCGVGVGAGAAPSLDDPGNGASAVMSPSRPTTIPRFMMQLLSQLDSAADVGRGARLLSL
jgi:hypothetical protein